MMARYPYKQPDFEMHPELLRIRSTFAEALAFGRMNHELFEKLFRELNAVYQGNETLQLFLQAKGLFPEFEQYEKMGETE